MAQFPMHMGNIVLSILIGGSAGALLGRFGRCKSDACPLTARWKRGAIYGAVAGMIFYFGFGGVAGPYHQPKNVKPVIQSNFDSSIAHAGKPVVVDFFATWCGSCKILSPRLDKLAGEFSDRIKFMSVNVDQSPALSARFNVEGIPTLLFFDKDGKLVDKSVGLLSSESLRAKLIGLSNN